MRRVAALALLAFAAGMTLAPAKAQAQSGDLCGDVREQLLVSDPLQKEQMQQSRHLSGDLLFGSSGTLRCLIDMLREPGINVTSTDIDPIQGHWLLRITGAIRSILTTRGTSAIREFRAADDLATTSVLAFAARSAEAGLRVNATLVLADVIDDSTVCVPIDHLYDPSLAATEGGTSGRINLIGVISVVAPWAYRPTYQNIERLLERLNADVKGKDLAQTKEVIANLQARLDFQKKTQKAPNMNSDLPFDQQDCTLYRPMWAGLNLRY
ncbi:MAG: hypothetical protein KF694_23465 [Mesorhizobium sp.]|nr:hypothetical protein [Mesorhizobium sp.]